MKKVLILITILMVGVCFAPVAPYAASEHLVSFQGIATDDAGNPEPSADVRVRIYDAATAGNLVYDSGTDFNNVSNADGVFDILLGSGSVALNLDNTLKYYMEIEVNGEEVVGDAVAGRQEFLPGSGDHTHMHDADYVNVGESNSVTGGMIVDSTINSTKIQDNTITAADLIGTNCSDVCTDANTTDCASCDPRFVNEGQADSIASGMVQFNYAGSASEGGPASDVTCSSCVGLTDINQTQVQRTLTQFCPAGNAIRQINTDGTVTCETDDTGITDCATCDSRFVNDCADCDTRFVNEADLDHLDAADGAPANALYVDNDGEVGIGTTTPNAKLSVGGSGYANTGIYGNSTSYAGYFENNDGSGSSDYAVFADANGSGTSVHFGVLGKASNGATNYGVRGEGTDYGVYGKSTSTSGTDYGVYGVADGSGGGPHYGGYFDASGAYANYGVYGNVVGQSGYNYGGSFYATGGSAADNVGVWARAYGATTFSNTGGYFAANGSSYQNYGVNSIVSYSSATATNYGGYFLSNSGATNYGVVASGDDYDFYAAGSGTNYGPFTGGHEVKLYPDFPEGVKAGMIVSVTGKTEIRHHNGAVSISSTLPTVELSHVANDKAVLGVFERENPLPKDHWYECEDGERFATVNALGEGRVWVSDINGAINAGDYITTSSVPGFGQLQNDDLLHSYTLGKAIETVEWDSVNETVEHNGTIHKVYLIGVVYTSG